MLKINMKMKMLAVAILISCIFSASAQWSYRGGVVGTGCDDLTGFPINYNMDFNTDIQPIFNFYGCVDCHDGSDGGFNLSTNSGQPLLPLLGTISQETGLALIEPEFPELSYIFQKINCQTPYVGVRMPFSGGMLSIEDQGILYDWIYQGALGEFPPGLWYRDLIYRNNLESNR